MTQVRALFTHTTSWLRPPSGIGPNAHHNCAEYICVVSHHRKLFCFLPPPWRQSRDHVACIEVLCFKQSPRRPPYDKLSSTHEEETAFFSHIVSRRLLRRFAWVNTRGERGRGGFGERSTTPDTSVPFQKLYPMVGVPYIFAQH